MTIHLIPLNDFLFAVFKRKLLEKWSTAFDESSQYKNSIEKKLTDLFFRPQHNDFIYEIKHRIDIDKNIYILSEVLTHSHTHTQKAQKLISHCHSSCSLSLLPLQFEVKLVVVVVIPLFYVYKHEIKSKRASYLSV